MALVVGASAGGGGGGVRVIWSTLLLRLLGVRSRPVLTCRKSDYRSSDEEDDETSPLINPIPRNISSIYNFCTQDGCNSSSARVLGAVPPPFGHPDWLARQVFDVRTGRPESTVQDLEMVNNTWQGSRRPREHVLPPVSLADTAPGQPPILRIPVTERLVASFLAQRMGVQVARTDEVIVTANRAAIPPSSDNKGGPIQWMKVFRALLLAHVFFALPLIVIFFPRYEKESSKKNVLLSLFDKDDVSCEKITVLVLFAFHASLGSLGILLAHIADDPKCIGIVGSFTLWTIISVVGLVDYMLLKTLPDKHTYKVFAVVHFIVMLLVICGLWAKFVGISVLLFQGGFE